MATRPEPSLDPEITAQAPTGHSVTDYDHRLMICYARLLDAAEAGVDWREAARVVLKLDHDTHPAQAKQAYDTHLARARWMTEQGYRQLLAESGSDG